MKIAFFPKSCIPIQATTLEKRPLGGTESAIIYLARSLHELGHTVFVFTAEQNPLPSEPLYLPYRALEDLGEVDVFVGVREWSSLFLPVQAKKKLLWMSDAYDQPVTLGLGDRRVQKQADALLCVSDWHANTLCEHSGFPRGKTHVLRNGVNLTDFNGNEKRVRKRLLYTSTPFRGLNLVPHIFKQLRAKHPTAEFHIFSGYDVYAGGMLAEDPRLARFEQLKNALTALPGCTVHGNLRQSELAREYMKSSILCYPNTFAETGCIAALEAQAAGCAIVSSELGALPESVGNAGILIKEKAGSTEYLAAFIDATDKLLSDDQMWKKLSQEGLRRAPGFAWKNIAQRLLDIVSKL